MKIVFLLVLNLSVISLAFIFFKSEKSLVGHNLSDLYIKPYSDSNITKNAIFAEERFEKLAFAPAPKTLETSVFDNVASVFSTIKSLFAKKPKTTSNEHGTWLWTPIGQLSDEYIDTILKGAKREGVNVIYLSVDSYLDIFVMEEGEAKERELALFNQKLENFIVKAAAKNIAVDAEAGWRNWAEDGHTYKPLAIVSFVKKYNEEHQNKFRGFQYDVEPYLLDDYQENKAEILKNFVTLVDDTTFFLKGSDLKFSVVVPDFYDREDRMTPRFYYNGKSDWVFGHLLRILESKEDASIIVMSYRNFAEGKNGSIDVSKNEMRTARIGGYSSNIILAQETGDVFPPFITFYNTSKDRLRVEMYKLDGEFASHPNFAGLAIHYANAYMELK